MLCYVLSCMARYIKGYIYLIFLGLCVSAVIAVKKNKLLYLFIYIGIIIANILINILQLKFLLRINTSWSVTIAFIILYLLVIARKNRYIYYFMIGLSLIILMYQTQKINNNFYKEYVEYEKEKSIAFDIAKKINENVKDKTKPIFYLYEDYIKNYNFKLEELEVGQGETIIYWSSYAFSEPGVEMTKFINSLGYNFNERQIKIEEYKESLKEYYALDDKTKEQEIVETDKYIYVKI